MRSRGVTYSLTMKLSPTGRTSSPFIPGRFSLIPGPPSTSPTSRRVGARVPLYCNLYSSYGDSSSKRAAIASDILHLAFPASPPRGFC